MTPQCTECLGYHGQAKPCPARKEIRLADACERCGSNWTTETQRETIREINRNTYKRLCDEIKSLRSVGSDEYARGREVADALYAEVNAYMRPTAQRMSSREGLREALLRYEASIIPDQADPSSAAREAVEKKDEALRYVLSECPTDWCKRSNLCDICRRVTAALSIGG